MELELDDKYRVTTVPLNFVLEERYTKETTDKETGNITKSEEWKFVGYYSSFKQVMKAYLSKTIMGSKETEAYKIVEEIARVEKVITSMADICLDKKDEDK